MLEQIRNRKWNLVRKELADIHQSEVANIIDDLPQAERTVVFRLLPRENASSIFEYLEPDIQQEIVRGLGKREVASILNDMSPDDRTAFLEKLPDPILKETLNLLTDEERHIASSLLGYDENSVGRLMTPYYIQAQVSWTVQQVFDHIRKYGKRAETLHVVYVVDDQQRLIDDIRISALLMAQPDALVEKLMDNKFIALVDTMDKEEAVLVFRQYDRSALPVITENGVLVGIVTADDIMDVAEEEATEDIQKFGGVEALDLPYVETPLLTLIRKRSVWLIVLFVGEMMTASAMGYFDKEIQKAVVLALFIPLVISSGGNSGSQAATLIIRAMALKELNLRDWWYVMRRELVSGLFLGVILGAIGFLRIIIWQQLGLFNYTDHFLLVAVTIFLTLIGIVMWGTLSGSMIPFLLKRLGLDPATSSAPFVATLVDVTGLLMYFTIAAIILRGTLL
ncbi:MAG TPA: magnesium transporter [Pyrinomonadaceae bacterium]|jgi:magnesium transporter|nr:magnesium transporter [Pyrinomonadaceae bacterium]